MGVSAKSTDLVRIEQVGGSVAMPGWMWCEILAKQEQKQAEIERLTLENHGLRLTCDARGKTIDGMEEDVERLVAALELSEEYNEQKASEIERLRADAERLQWLEVNKIQSYWVKMDGNKGFRLSGGWPELRGRTFREAIDCAMAETARAVGGE